MRADGVRFCSDVASFACGDPFDFSLEDGDFEPPPVGWLPPPREDVDHAADDPSAGPPVPPPPPRPFRSFTDPMTADDSRVAIAELFAAMEAFGREHDVPRGRHQTPAEWARRLSAAGHVPAADAAAVIAAYEGVVYNGGRRPEAAQIAAANRLWRSMKDAEMTAA